MFEKVIIGGIISVLIVGFIVEQTKGEITPYKACMKEYDYICPIAMELNTSECISYVLDLSHAMCKDKHYTKDQDEH